MLSEFHVVTSVTIPALNVQFIFTSSFQQERSCLTQVICVCLRIVVSNTYWVVFVFCLSSAYVAYLPVSLDCPFLIDPSVYLQRLLHLDTRSNKETAFYCCSSYFVICFTGIFFPVNTVNLNCVNFIFIFHILLVYMMTS